ncbi:MAG: hypothetical protein UT61_C0053G0003 [Candidatus Woesebacteria bacterium GW2011_GWA1_39_8]|uniref:Uncharacterized protein n=1 Tax=Candidatus Woesebacteria bacterium GW2011_GWA1_39_8 TaxID=1618552 RepID=A0A0G0SRP5_9BACT|nr:MAG: hypothetical protein UT61_C0053G0003 [Candidatus Woesebacteria bacterium GW2011_GWA1_39_8]
MGVVFIKDKVVARDLGVAQKDYGKYIKIVVDVKNNLVAIGGEWHVDGEKVLLENGADKDSIWGGGIDSDTKNIETVALINLRPNLGNNSQEILDANARKRFIEIVKERFGV